MTTPPTTTIPQDRVPASLPAPPSGAARYDPRHRGVRVVGAAVVGLVTLALAAGSVPQMVRDSQTETFALPEGTQELRIVGDVGDVDLRGVAAGGQTGIDVAKHWSFREPQARMRTSGTVTTMTVDCPGFPTPGQCYSDWEVTVPEDLTVFVQTSVGDIGVAQVTGDLVLRSAVGKVTLAGTPSSVEISTSVGDVDAVLGAPADRVAVRTSVGEVRVTLPGGVAYDLEATGLEPADVRVDTSRTSEHEVVVESSVGSVLVDEG